VEEGAEGAVAAGSLTFCSSRSKGRGIAINYMGEKYKNKFRKTSKMISPTTGLMVDISICED
jgi:hypothetical protein